MEWGAVWQQNQGFMDSELFSQLFQRLPGDEKAGFFRQADPLFLLRTRRSVRRFLPDPVPMELVERALEMAALAPSAHNRQPWRFAVLMNETAKVRLAEQMGAAFRQDLQADGLTQEEIEAQVERSRQRITQAPVANVLCLDLSQGDNYPDPRRQKNEYLMGVQGVAMAGENLLLAAHALGLGGVWMCAPLFAPEAVRRALDLPEVWEPQGLVLLGYPARTPQVRPRFALREVARFY